MSRRIYRLVRTRVQTVHPDIQIGWIDFWFKTINIECTSKNETHLNETHLKAYVYVRGREYGDEFDNPDSCFYDMVEVYTFRGTFLNGWFNRFGTITLSSLLTFLGTRLRVFFESSSLSS